MSRRTNERNTRAPLSFFDEDEATHGLGVTPKKITPSARKISPRVTRPPQEFKKPARSTVPHATGPKAGSKREKLAHIKHFKGVMQVHFKHTHEILDEQKSWPRYATFERIEKYIQKIQTEYVTPIWDGKDTHKSKVEHIHSNHVNTADMDLNSIYKRVSTFAEENGVKNRLTLSEPVGNESHKPYANVVLAWLFAAKKQLMFTLTVYLKTHKVDDAQARKFIHESEAGADARAKFKELKAQLPHREPRAPFFADHAALEEQHAALHAHRAA
jgi:hypothetical protein